MIIEKDRSPYFYCEATLVVLPPHLLFQWEQEISKFTGDKLKVLTISNIDSIVTYKEMLEMDIVLVSVRLFESERYQELFLGCNISSTAAAMQTPSSLADKKDSAKITMLEKHRKRDEQYLKVIGEINQVKKFNESNSYLKGKKKSGAMKSSSVSYFHSSNSSIKYALECYFWDRIVIDEIHELVQSEDSIHGLGESTFHEMGSPSSESSQSHSQSSAGTSITPSSSRSTSASASANASSSSFTSPNISSQIWTLPIRSLNANSKWGLTGTPNVHELKSINSLGVLLGVNLGDSKVKPAKQFMDSCCRRSKREENGYPEPIEKFVYVSQCIY
jgi:hypothetical protein